MEGLEVARVKPENKPEIERFLMERKEFCVFLLDNLKKYGVDPKEGEIFSGSFYSIIGKEKSILCVFYCNLAGNVIVQGDSKTDYSEQIISTLDFRSISGILGDDVICESLAKKLVERKIWNGISGKKESLLDLPLKDYEPVKDKNSSIPRKEDFESYYENSLAFDEECGVPTLRSKEDQLAYFLDHIKDKDLFVTYNDINAPDETRIVISQSVITSRVCGLGVIGGVYTKKEFRRKGNSTKNLMKLIETSQSYHKFEKLVLFTDIDSGAEKLYEKLGFKRIGFFGLFFKKKQD